MKFQTLLCLCSFAGGKAERGDLLSWGKRTACCAPGGVGFRVTLFRWPLTTIKSTLRQFRSPQNSLSWWPRKYFKIAGQATLNLDYVRVLGRGMCSRRVQTGREGGLVTTSVAWLQWQPDNLQFGITATSPHLGETVFQDWDGDGGWIVGRVLGS